MFASNLIPLGSIIGGFIIGWRSGRDPVIEVRHEESDELYTVL